MIYTKQVQSGTSNVFLLASNVPASAVVFYPSASGNNARVNLAFNPSDLGSPLVSAGSACTFSTTWGDTVKLFVYNNGTNLATGTAALSGAANNTRGVSSITITSGGYGYVTAPTITFTGAITGTNYPTAVATLSGSRVRTVTITNPGTGYNVAPTVTFSSPPSPIIKFLVVSPSNRQTNLVTLTFSNSNAITGVSVVGQGPTNWTPEFGRKRLLGYF